MLFNSLEFLVFFAVVAPLHFLLPHRFRWALLLAASYYFYMAWKPVYILLIVVSTVIDYIAGRAIGRSTDPSVRLRFLLLSFACNLGLLFSFKYLGFFGATVNSVLSRCGVAYALPHFDVLLPVGISFYTFQTMSYTIEVYRGRQTPEKHFGIFALYVAFFPQLVAGPIERSHNLLPQFRPLHRFDYARTVSGLQLMLWGMFKKVVIADHLAVYVDRVYGDLGACSGPVIALGTVFFAYQIYCDFSGYSDIAIGAARILGFDLMRNFDTPYHARSIAEFWKRWHISLSTWFQDYVYIPLGGSRVSVRRFYINVLITFCVSGLWHGANWTFIVWGFMHAMYYMVSRATHPLRERLGQAAGLPRNPRIHAFLRLASTFVLVNIAWVFFRARDLSSAWAALAGLTRGWRFSWIDALQEAEPATLWMLLGIAALECCDTWQRRRGFDGLLAAQPAAVRWLIYIGLAVTLMNFGAIGEVPFIYFQF